MRSTTAGKVVGFLLVAAAVLAGAVWLRGEFRDLRHDVDGLKPQLRLSPPSPPPAPAGPPLNVRAPDAGPAHADPRLASLSR